MKTTGRVDDDMVSVLGGLNRQQGFNTLGLRRAAANGSSNIGDLQSGV